MPTKRPRPVTSDPESGFMLASTTGLILIVVALLSTFVFVVQRDYRFKNHYATGQRLADIASYAHLFSQRIFHEGSPVSGVILFDSTDPASSSMGFADQAIFAPIGGISYETEIRGWDSSPIADMTAPDKAVSAYMQVRIRPIGNQVLRPTDRTAFMAGAAQKGMTRIGVIDTSSAELCDGQPQAVRWGPESTACLSDGQLATLGFSDIQNGDLIIPTWEVALANASSDAIFRYKQPERPELNAMTTNLQMNGTDRDITDIEGITTRNITASDTAEIQEMQVRDGNTMHVAQHATTNGQLFVRNDNAADPTVPSMQVSGVTQFNTLQFNVADTINVGDISNPVSVDVINPIAVNAVTGMGTDLTIDPINGATPLTLAAQQSSLPFASLTIDSPDPDAHLAVTGALNMPVGSTLTASGIYSGNFNILPTATGLAASGGINVGAIEQIGLGTNYLDIRSPVSTPICTGMACPDYVTDTPGGEL